MRGGYHRYLMRMSRRQRSYKRNNKRQYNSKSNHKNHNDNFVKCSDEDIMKYRSESKLVLPNGVGQCGIEEIDVGICAYVSPNVSGFSGILKHRFTDFIVNEVDLNGNIACITRSLSDEVDEHEHDKHGDDDMNAENTGAVNCVDDDSASFLSKLFPDNDVIDTFREFMGKLDDSDEYVFPTQRDSKLGRKELHGLIRSQFPKLVSDTVDGCVRVRVRTARLDQQEKRMFGWHSSRPQHLKFVVRKMGMDSGSCVNMLSHFLRVKSLKFAGTKDKRAVTSQFMTVYRVSKKKMKNLANMFQRSAMTVGNLEYTNEGLGLGDLSGNRFTVTLRDVKAEKSAMEQALNSLAANGFVNYFGLQRFGAIVPTHLIGRAILHRKYDEAIAYILVPRDGERQEDREAREYFWDTRDLRGALCKMPKYMSTERTLLKGMLDVGNNFSTVLDRLPRARRSLYVHSYQSLLWNKVATRRLELSPSGPMVGDLVWGDAAVVQSNAEMHERNMRRLRAPLDASDVASGKHSLSDVLLPIPGFEIEYPPQLRSYYEELVISDGFASLDDFHGACEKQKMKGAYRELVMVPKNVKHCVVQYSDVHGDIVDATAPDLTLLPGSVTDTRYTALVLQFVLPSSTYATMLFRELLKLSTSRSSLIAMTNSYETNTSSAAVAQTKNSQETPLSNDT